MFNKKINLILITLVFMLSISSVAAFETNTVDETETSEADEEPPSGSALVESDVKSISQDDYSLETKDLSMYYKNGTRYEVTLMQGDNPIKNASVIINICGINYTKVTNNEGKAFLGIKLNPGNYPISTSYKYDSNSIKLESEVEVLSTLSGKDIIKTYKNSTQYQAAFLDNNGNPLTDSNVTFNINGVFYTRKTNNEGIAKLNIYLNSGEYILTAIHQNGLMCSNLITVLPSLNATDVVKYYMSGTQYLANFYDSQGNPLKRTNVTFNINGVFYTRQTNDDGIARLNIKLLPKSYIITAINPVNGEMASNMVNVLSTIISSDLVSDNENISFDVILINNDGSAAQNKNMTIQVDNKLYNLTTNEKGLVRLELNLSYGIHNVISSDLETGLRIYNIVNVTSQASKILQYYSQYGVSPDNKTIMAIGRPSASGELSEYGYKFYMTIFERVCPYCGSTELYWGIFWTGDETGNYGVFPATGNKEGGSAEGHIFCANCDSDWSIFGNNHGNGYNLTALTQSVLSSKSAAYMLKNGEMIYS